MMTNLHLEHFVMAFKGTLESGSQCKKQWLIKKYNDKLKNTIVDNKDDSGNPYEKASTNAHCG